MIRILSIFLGVFISFTYIYADTQPSMSEFLHSSKESYSKIIEDTQNLQEIHFVMGNESADLDSIISSITYAYLLNAENPHQFYIPLLNLFREELALRKETQYLLQLVNIPIEDLLFLDDQVPLDTLYNQDRLRFSLVDHNTLRPRQVHLSDVVERIVDHHADENQQYPLLSDEDKLIAVVGSATTLVAEKLLASDKVKMTPELAALLLGPILIDTTDLQSVEKTTERDIKAVEVLRSIALETIPENFYEDLLAAKNDISGLTPPMLLSKDFKEYLDGKLLYGISSLPSSVTWWTPNIEEMSPVLEKYARDRELAFLILLMANNDPQGPKRKIIVYSCSSRLLEAFNHYVESDEILNSTLIAGPTSQDPHLSLYLLDKFTSRKQLQPLFHFSENQDIISVFF